MLYGVLKVLLRIGMLFYYRRISFKGRDNLSYTGPKILIANHPNTMMDAWILGAASREPVYFMAKGTFFNTRLKRALLSALGLIPINRSVDEKTAGVTNEDSFEQCYRLLESGRTVAIFPEGNSFSERMLRKLKSGTARIALQTEERNDGKLGIRVIPVGIIYQQPDKFRSAVIVRIGAPIDPSPYLSEFRTDRLKAARKLTEVFRIELSKLLVVAESKTVETLSDKVASILDNAYAGKGSRFEKRMEQLKVISERIAWIERNDQELFREIDELTDKINWQLERMAIKASFLERRFRSTMFIRQLLQSVLGLTIALPIYLYGVFHHFLPFKLSEWLMKRLVAEVEYYAPVAILVGLVLYPLNYWGFYVLIQSLFEPSMLFSYLYLISLPISGLFAYSFYLYYQHISFKWKFILMMIDRKDAMDRLQEDRDRLKRLIYSDSDS